MGYRFTFVTLNSLITLESLPIVTWHTFELVSTLALRTELGTLMGTKIGVTYIITKCHPTLVGLSLPKVIFSSIDLLASPPLKKNSRSLECIPIGCLEFPFPTLMVTHFA